MLPVMRGLAAVVMRGLAERPQERRRRRIEADVRGVRTVVDGGVRRSRVETLGDAGHRPDRGRDVLVRAGADSPEDRRTEDGGLEHRRDGDRKPVTRP